MAKYEVFNEDIETLNNKEYIIPVFSHRIDHIKGESLMFFDNPTKIGNSKARVFFGIGKVYRVVKGEKQDLVYINFGIFKRVKTRLVSVIDNHSRRQTLMLKRGQICEVYGVSRYYRVKTELNGKTFHGVRLALYAHGFNAWYVPKALDIKKSGENTDLQMPTESENEIMDFLTLLEKENNDE